MQGLGVVFLQQFILSSTSRIGRADSLYITQTRSNQEKECSSPWTGYERLSLEVWNFTLRFVYLGVGLTTPVEHERRVVACRTQSLPQSLPRKPERDIPLRSEHTLCQPSIAAVVGRVICLACSAHQPSLRLLSHVCTRSL